ncbi:hypothetical protein CORC01_02294 [Colletotrichum orchidophilum]|uniref:Zn(2)-C6 fungal-type domain-containing protein n=1 Tax=Colletotrichum orchidophilum TaxID=1209926 RepID=A0A1G4BLI4_9PEZI|nr:uncharacterized protein CORC01_02294 [Colletotrichum orchidophilum]OHF02301.1 hypothetical protein CORC01_02294 [Colletotrichum orchidophilum]
MSSPAPATYLGRKRTKTFTGCWTCRSRRVKCDETKPHCSPCKLRGLDCQGYGVRLQWLPSETVFPSEPSLSCIDLANYGTNSRSFRRQVPTSPVQSVLPWSQVEGILKLIDSVEPGSSSFLGGDLCINVESFGVFDSNTLSNVGHQSRVGDYLVPEDIREEESGQIIEAEFATSTSSPGTQTSERPQLLPSPSHSETEAAWELCNLHVQQHLQTELGHVGPAEATDNPTDLQNEEPTIAVSSPLSSPRRRLGYSFSTEPSRTPTFSISDRERFLMHHYVHRVVNIFCVIDNAKSPWKTIHLPRAIQGAGELSVMGATSRIRNALRNALLSISAYYFSNVQTSGTRLEAESKWIEAATLYRYNAIGLLKQAVEVDLHAPGRPKYKEFLATMLSMITINVGGILVSSQAADRRCLPGGLRSKPQIRFSSLLHLCLSFSQASTYSFDHFRYLFKLCSSSIISY